MTVMDILRIAAAALAFFVCAFEGYRRSRELRDRTVFLSEISSLLERFSIGIRCAALTSDELLECENGSFAKLVNSFKNETGDLRSAWEKACETLPQKREETALLRELGRTLGNSDKEGALRLLERCKSEFAALKAAADTEYSKRGKALFQVGTLCGIGTAIMII